MRGLPPLPPDVLTIEADWGTNASRCSTAWRAFCPGASAMEPLELSSIIAQWFDFALPELLNVLPSATVCNTCRVSCSGPTGAALEEPLADNHGAFGEATPINAALVLTWRTQDGPNGGHYHSWLPLVDAFVDDNLRQLKPISYAQAGSAARSYVTAINGITVAGFGTLVMAGVSRVSAGAPRPSSTWSPVTVGDASIHLGTIRRRVKPRR